MQTSGLYISLWRGERCPPCFPIFEECPARPSAMEGQQEAERESPQGPIKVRLLPKRRDPLSPRPARRPLPRNLPHLSAPPVFLRPPPRLAARPECCIPLLQIGRSPRLQANILLAKAPFFNSIWTKEPHPPILGDPPRPPSRQKGRRERARAHRRAAFPRPSPLFPLFGSRPTKCSPNWYFTAAKAGKCGILIPFKIVL